MPLNLQTNDGDFTPYIKYNAKAGRWYIKVEGQDGDQEVVNPTLAFDFANIKTGWFFFMEGIQPEKVWDPSLDTSAPKPAGTKAFKRGFEVAVYGRGNIGLREFASTAGAMVSPLLNLYAQWEKLAAANPGKVPVFACTGVKPISGKHGTNYSPQFAFKEWIPRAVFDANGKPNDQNYTGWTLEEAIRQCMSHGLTRDDIVNAVKAGGHKGWNAMRDTATVQALIAARQASAQQEESFDDGQAFDGPDAPPPDGDDAIPW